MASPSKVVQFSDFQKPPEFSQPSQSGAKIASQSDSAKVSETPENMGLAPISDTSNAGELEGTTGAGETSKAKLPKAKSLKKKPAKTYLAAKPAVTASPGPEGYKTDCASLTPGQLHAAYPGEYQSWKDSTSRCKKKKWVWASEWDSFKDFLASMGPKPSPAHTLDRIDSAVPAYGPGLCQWADKIAQNNNKSDNIKIIVPLTGEVFTAQKLAKLHDVNVKTVYKWKSSFYSDLELIAGKKLKPLRDLSVALDELAVSLPPKGQKAPIRQLKIPTFMPPTFPDELEPTPEEYDHYLGTGEMKCKSRYQIYRECYDALVEWTKRYNVGLPVSPAPPAGRYWNVQLPPNVGKPNEPAPAKPKAIPDHADLDHEYNEHMDFDPTDCVPDYDE
jgi:hypothetical protein